MATVQKIVPNLWFHDNAEDAVNYYVSIFKDSAIGKISRYTEAGFEIHGMPAGTVMTIEFTIEGQQFLALNGGPYFKFNEAVSFIVNCDSQEEIDYYWDHLTKGGDPKAQQCGWLKDKFGLSWQVNPTIVNDMLTDEDPAKANEVMREVLQMKKPDITKLQRAYDRVATV